MRRRSAHHCIMGPVTMTTSTRGRCTGVDGRAGGGMDRSMWSLSSGSDGSWSSRPTWSPIGAVWEPTGWALLATVAAVSAAGAAISSPGGVKSPGGLSETCACMDTGEQTPLIIAAQIPAGSVHASPSGGSRRVASAIIGSSSLATRPALDDRRVRTSASASSIGSGPTTLSRDMAGDGVTLGVVPL